MKVTGTLDELTAAFEKKEVSYYNGTGKESLEELLLQDSDYRAHEFKNPIKVIGLYYDAYNHPEEQSEIEFVVETEKGEKAVLYTSGSEQDPFWCEVMVLSITNENGKKRKFYFNGEYHHLDLDTENCTEAKQEHERLQKEYHTEGYELYFVVSK